MKHEFPVTLTDTPGRKPDPYGLSFGTVFTDHMFIMDYSDDKGWHDGRIIPYGPLRRGKIFQKVIFSRSRSEELV